MTRLHTHLKRMVVKASVMRWTIAEVHKHIDEILDKYGVKHKLPKERKANT